MDTSFIQSLFNFMTNNIFPIIFIFAGIEIVLVILITTMTKKHETVLSDVCDNLMKGFTDAPDKDSDQTVNERIQASLDFVSRKVTQDPSIKYEFAKNAKNISKRPLYTRHYKIEMYTSVMSTLVQIFPLLGILGTILAIAQTAGGGKVDVSALSNAFVLAMDTTILGIGFSIIFMVAESILWPKVERVIHESSNFKKIVTDVSVSSNG
jgi:biopolymer transport protein ExbB/TolQ